MKPTQFVLHEDPTDRRWHRASFFTDEDTERGSFKTLESAKRFAFAQYGIDPTRWEEHPGYFEGVAFYYAFTRFGYRFEILPQGTLQGINLNIDAIR